MRRRLRSSEVVWLLALGGALLALGCAGNYRNCLRLDQNTAGIESEQCNRECKLGHNEGDFDYLRCLAACPGVEVTQNDKCTAEDVRPGMICLVTDMNLDPSSNQTASSGDGVGSAIAGIVGAIAVGAIASAIDRKSSGSSSSSSSSSDSNAGTSRNAGARPKTQSHKPASPSKSHKAASPSK